MNMQKIMQQAQKMQRDLQNKKDEIAKMIFVGENEWVKVEVNGSKELVSCNIKQSSIAPDDIEVLQDYIVLAVKKAIEAADKEYQDKLGSYAGMLDGLM